MRFLFTERTVVLNSSFDMSSFHEQIKILTSTCGSSLV